MKKIISGIYRKIYGTFMEGYDLWQQMLNIAVIVAILGAVFSVFISLALGNSVYAIAAFVFAAVFAVICLIISMKMKDVTFAAVLFSIVANFVLFPIMYFTSGGFHGGMPLWLLLSLVISWVVIRKRSILFVVYGLSIIFQSGCIIYSQAHPEVVVLFQTEQAVVWDIIQSMILVSLIFGMIIKFHERAYETKKNELDKANAALAKANERITLQSMYTLAKTIDAKDKYTNGHSMRVAGYSRMIAERMGYSEADLEDIYNMAMLHDIGKIGVPDAIINKPTKLTDEEFYIIRKHPVTGYEILSEMPEFKEISAGARWHHERYDGTGYPDGLAGEDIPLFARIITVADAYDAMTSNRSYRLYMSQDTVIAELKKGKGKQFDPDITDVMLEIIKEDSDYEFREGQFTHQDAV